MYTSQINTQNLLKVDYAYFCSTKIETASYLFMKFVQMYA